MQNGFLKLYVFTGNYTFPIPGAKITIFRDGKLIHFYTTDKGGQIPLTEISAPDEDLSNKPDNVTPYTIINLTVLATGYRTAIYNGIQVFAGETSIAYANMIPIPDGEPDVPIVYNLQFNNL